MYSADLLPHLYWRDVFPGRCSTLSTRRCLVRLDRHPSYFKCRRQVFHIHLPNESFSPTTIDTINKFNVPIARLINGQKSFAHHLQCIGESSLAVQDLSLHIQNSTGSTNAHIPVLLERFDVLTLGIELWTHVFNHIPSNEFFGHMLGKSLNRLQQIDRIQAMDNRIWRSKRSAINHQRVCISDWDRP